MVDAYGTDLVSNQPVVRANAAVAAGVFGPSAEMTASSAMFTCDSAALLGLQPPLTVAYVGTQWAGSGTSVFYAGTGVTSGAAPYAGYALGNDGAYRYTFHYNIAGGYSALVAASYLSMTMRGRLVLVGTMAPDARRIYVNGAEGAVSLGTASIGAFSGLFYVNGWVGRNSGTGFSYAAVWNRALSATEVARLSADPFSLLAA